MKLKAFASILAIIFLISLMGCGGSSSSTPPPSISVAFNPAPPTSLQINATASLTAVVSNDSANAGVTWSVTCGSAGACGGFNLTSTASGAATTYTAPAAVPTGNTVTVTATSVTDTTKSAPATITITATAVASSNYSFYLSGMESVNGGPNFYALAGSVTIDANGNVVTGEQDYNDGTGYTFPGDTISGGTLTWVDAATGQGTLTLITGNTSLGASGVETLGVQFVNTNHALIVQFDGSATSSGSMDLQTLSSTLNDGNYAFTLSGVDATYYPVVFGGVFQISASGTALQGVFDANDAGVVKTEQPFSATISTADGFGRGTITVANGNIATTVIYYIIGPEAIRIIDMDATDSGVGSAFGQGTGTFSSTSLGKLRVWCRKQLVRAVLCCGRHVYHGWCRQHFHGCCGRQ